MAKDSKAIKSAEKMMEQARSKRAAEILEKNKALRDAVAEHDKAAEAVKTMLYSGDTEKYIAAKEREAAAAEVVAACNDTVNALERTPMITSREYESAVAAIVTEIKSAEIKLRNRIATETMAWCAEIDALQAAVDKANGCLRQLQHDVYLDADMEKDEAGNIINRLQGIRDVDIANTLIWRQYAVSNPQLSAMRREME